MKTLAELKKEFDGVPIGFIEKRYREAAALATENIQRQVEILFYLESTQRWRENKIYAKSDFATYLKDQGNMTPATYQGTRIAMARFPEEVRKRGIGLVRSIKEKCGSGNTKIVLDEIKAEEVKQGRDLRRDEISGFVQKHKIPAMLKRENRPTRSALERINVSANDIIVSLRNELGEKEARIDKLITAVKVKDAIIAQLETRLRQAEAELKKRDEFLALPLKEFMNRKMSVEA